MTKVFNKYHGKIPADAIWIMRGKGNWGNPFEIGKDGNRDEVVEKHKQWFLSQPELILKAQLELRGKDLVCCCAPKACHGDILLEIANLAHKTTNKAEPSIKTDKKPTRFFRKLNQQS